MSNNFTQRGKTLLKRVEELQLRMQMNMNNSKYDDYKGSVEGLKQALSDIQKDFDRAVKNKNSKSRVSSKTTKVSQMNKSLSNVTTPQSSSTDSTANMLSDIAARLNAASNKLS